MVHLDGEPLGADAGNMDLSYLLELAPLVTETNTAPMVPDVPIKAAPNGAGEAEEAGPKAAS